MRSDPGTRRDYSFHYRNEKSGSHYLSAQVQQDSACSPTVKASRVFSSDQERRSDSSSAVRKSLRLSPIQVASNVDASRSGLGGDFFSEVYVFCLTKSRRRYIALRCRVSRLCSPKPGCPKRASFASSTPRWFYVSSWFCVSSEPHPNPDPLSRQSADIVVSCEARFR